MSTLAEDQRLARLMGRRYKHLRLEWRPDIQAVRVATQVKPIQCYSLGAMTELRQMLSDIEECQGLVKHFVMTSGVPGVFNYGGDLGLFVQLVKARDAHTLRQYGRMCVDLLWWMECAAERGVHTVVLVQGTTLGGGLESTLPFHHVIFEESAKAGFPEVRFNLFPGMGAWHFMMRKSSETIAKKLILGGAPHAASQLLEMGVIDEVVPDGTGDAAVDAYLNTAHARHRGILGALLAQRHVKPITLESLLTVVDVWVDTALTLTRRDMALMERLAQQQARNIAGLGNEEAMDTITRTERDAAFRREFGQEHTGITEWGALEAG